MSSPIVGSSKKSTSGSVQQGRGQLAAHALAQGELAHRGVEERVEVEEPAAAGQAGGVVRGRHAVHVAQQRERVGERQIPPELGALAEHDADPARQAEALGHRLEAADPHVAGGGVQHAGEHLQGGRLARAVRPDIAERLAALHGQVDVVHRGDDARPAAQPARLDAHAELLAKAARLDDRHDPVLR